MCEQKCMAPHTSYQPEQAEWFYPKCGLVGDFVIDPPADAAADDCELLRDTDECRCYGCEYAAYGKEAAEQLAKKANRIKCKCCGGTGWTSTT